MPVAAVCSGGAPLRLADLGARAARGSGNMWVKKWRSRIPVEVYLQSLLASGAEREERAVNGIGAHEQRSALHALQWRQPKMCQHANALSRRWDSLVSMLLGELVDPFTELPCLLPNWLCMLRQPVAGSCSEI